MAPRSNWKGYLKLSLVSASIAIYPATSSTEKVSFNTLNRATGNRLKRQMVDAVTGDVVESEEQVKGYAVGKDQYVTVEDDELANVAIESTHTVEIEKFVPKATIDGRYRDTPYYLAPEDKVGQEAFAVIRDAMKKKRVGIARVVMARRERIMMLEAFGKGIMGTTLQRAAISRVISWVYVQPCRRAVPPLNLVLWVTAGFSIGIPAFQRYGQGPAQFRFYGN